ncbi:hypothetical protein JHK82_028004 [Glycine max]|nr:hypothetical protein JHK82_028004 [Glycine max]
MNQRLKEKQKGQQIQLNYGKFLSDATNWLRLYFGKEVFLKAATAVEVLLAEEIPWAAFNVVECLSRLFAAGRLAPMRPEHLPGDEVDRLIGKLPRTLLERLLPF